MSNTIAIYLKFTFILQDRNIIMIMIFAAFVGIGLLYMVYIDI